MGTIITYITENNLMEHRTHTLPFYQRLSFILITLGILCVALIYGRSIILPLLFGILLANLLLPFTKYLCD